MNKTRNLIITLAVTLLLTTAFTACEHEPADAEYTVRYDANGASGTPPAPVTGVREGDYIIAADSGGLTYSGKVLAGWRTASAGTGRLYLPGDWFWPEADTTLYAQWADWTAPKNVSVTYTDGFLITWDAIPGVTDFSDNYLDAGEQFIAYGIFRYNKSSGNFEVCGFSGTASYRDTRWDWAQDYIFNYIVALVEITMQDTANYSNLRIGPESEVASGGRLYGLGETRPAPTGLSTIALSPTELFIAWDAVPGAYGYRLYDGTMEGNTITFTRSLSRYTTSTWINYTGIATSLTPGSTYYFAVASVNGFYEDGPMSDVVSVTMPTSAVTLSSYNLNFKNNHLYPVTEAYLRRPGAGWGNNLIGNPIVTNATQLLGTFIYGPYELMARSLLQSKLTTSFGSNSDRTIYVPVYYRNSFSLMEDRTVIALAADWHFN